jgi:hypothetical protein
VGDHRQGHIVGEDLPFRRQQVRLINAKGGKLEVKGFFGKVLLFSQIFAHHKVYQAAQPYKTERCDSNAIKSGPFDSDGAGSNQASTDSMLLV